MNTFKRHILVVSLLLLTACSLTNSSDEETVFNEEGAYNSYFPMGENLFWEYELTYSDADPKRPTFPHPLHFTTRIIDKVEVDQRDYYRIENYFIPGMPTTGGFVLVRRIEEDILVFHQEEEQLLYTFDDPESLWSLLLYVDEDKTTAWENWSRVHSIDMDNEEVIILWTNSKSVGRAHLVWEEHFKKGIGRTKIIIKGQVFGTTIFELTNTNVPEGE